MARAAVGFVVSLAAAVAATPFSTDGITVRVPHNWFVTARPLTNVVDPPQRLVVASYPLTQRAADPDCAPTTALARMPSDGVFIFVLEYKPSGALAGQIRRADFPRRPARFRLTHFARYECFGPSYMLRFRLADRYFQIHVAFGQRAGADERRAALAVLDSLSVKASRFRDKDQPGRF